MSLSGSTSSITSQQQHPEAESLTLKLQLAREKIDQLQSDRSLSIHPPGFYVSLSVCPLYCFITTTLFNLDEVTPYRLTYDPISEYAWSIKGYKEVILVS